MITNSEARNKRIQELRTALEQECGSFGIVTWSDEDIVTALIGQGIYPSPENIAAVKNSRLVQHIDEQMTETAWELIYETVGDVDFKPSPLHNFKPELSRRYELSGEDWEHIKSMDEHYVATLIDGYNAVLLTGIHHHDDTAGYYILSSPWTEEGEIVDGAIESI